MKFLKRKINQSFIALTLISAAFVSCETEESEEIGITEDSEISVDSEVTVLTEEEFSQNITYEDANIDEGSVAVDDLLTSSSNNELQIRLDGLNTYFYVDNGAMKNWESFRVYYTTHSYSTGTKAVNFSVNASTDSKWIGAKVWGSGNNRATVRIVPFSANNDTYYWGKARTYYLWFNSTGGNTLYVTPNSWDPNGN